MSKSTDPVTHSEWIDLESAARVELSSEHPDHPFESALSGHGWRANEAGEKTIRIMFDEPRDLHRILLRFTEAERERTQEFTLRWKPGLEEPFREIVRQQWNFSPNGSTVQTEDHRVQLRGAVVLELTIRPDMTGGDAVASLREFRVA